MPYVITEDLLPERLGDVPKQHVQGQLYAMVMRDDRFWLVGPFADRAALTRFWWTDREPSPIANPADDPRWQSIRLADAQAPVEVLTPEAHIARVVRERAG